MDNAPQGRTAGPTPTRCQNPACWLQQPEATTVCRMCGADKKMPVVPAVLA